MQQNNSGALGARFGPNVVQTTSTNWTSQRGVGGGSKSASERPPWIVRRCVACRTLPLPAPVHVQTVVQAPKASYGKGTVRFGWATDYAQNRSTIATDRVQHLNKKKGTVNTMIPKTYAKLWKPKRNDSLSAGKHPLSTRNDKKHGDTQ